MTMNRRAISQVTAAAAVDGVKRQKHAE